MSTNIGTYATWEPIDEYLGRKVFHGSKLSEGALVGSEVFALAMAEAKALERAHRLTNGLAPKFHSLQTHMHEGKWYVGIVMERIHGILARDYFGNALDWSAYAKTIIERLGACGVHHGDLNPQNVIITQTGFRVIDWDASYIQFLEDE